MSEQNTAPADAYVSAPPVWEQTKRVLEEEANVLAKWLDDTEKDTRPHRGDIAVLREIKRLRDLGAAITPNTQ